MLSLSYSEVTDEDLKDLAGCKRLHRLNLQSTAVTDDGIIHLRSLQSLRHLELYDTKVTEDGARDLQKALPDCLIELTLSNRGDTLSFPVSVD